MCQLSKDKMMEASIMLYLRTRNHLQMILQIGCLEKEISLQEMLNR